mmetsp:Transcript_25016/g.48647  ORF Transcript_25016/g.48647 Transcript_25016/m.48647 type:complete len:227 (+) Transcript_25016:151-831(+)
MSQVTPSDPKNTRQNKCSKKHPKIQRNTKEINAHPKNRCPTCQRKKNCKPKSQKTTTRTASALPQPAEKKPVCCVCKHKLRTTARTLRNQPFRQLENMPICCPSRPPISTYSAQISSKHNPQRPAAFLVLSKSAPAGGRLRSRHTASQTPTAMSLGSSASGHDTTARSVKTETAPAASATTSSGAHVCMPAVRSQTVGTAKSLSSKAMIRSSVRARALTVSSGDAH